MDTPEFTIDTIVTLDRYNHKDNTKQGIVIGYDKAPVSNSLLYVLNVGNTIIKTTGRCIIQSKDYVEPTLDDRTGLESFWERERAFDKMLQEKFGNNK